ncbi:RrF2 family transcriptional regulator [Baekduia sp. Peel2402]|uniref:RrF2 family transcriptional regulator n=1 Tax=Baekduia sp. Peel2402 TaxID=3458296 RepID=UPI00403ECB2F
MRAVRISAKGDYAVRAAIELALAGDEPLSADTIAARQAIPTFFMKKILNDMARAGIVQSLRGRDGGNRLARPAKEIAVADILRAIEGPLADVHGTAPERLDYPNNAEPLREVWFALRANLRGVLETVTLDQLATGRLPKRVANLAQQDDARLRR